MKKSILFLDQQSWQSGAQRVLNVILDAVQGEFNPLVGLPNEGPYAKTLRQRQIETLTFPLGSYRPGRKSVPEMAKFAARSLYCGLKLAPVILKRDVHLVYINGPRWLPAGALSALLTRRPSLFHLHNTLTRRSDLFLASRVARYVSRIVACSNAAAASLLAARPDLAAKTQVVRNPVIEDEASLPSHGPHREPATGINPFVVGMVGRITKEKGHLYLLRALGQLRSSLRQDFRLVIVGAPSPDSPQDRAYAEHLKLAVSELGLDGRVEWAGYQVDPGPYYLGMDVLVLPSSGSASEGLPMVLLEALYRGVPVIASRMAGTPEIVQEGRNGLLVPPGDVTALAKALDRVLGDPQLYRQLRAGTRASLDERFSARNFQHSVYGLVSELVAPASALEVEPGWEGAGGK